MPVFNYARREVNAKIVYYGPGLSGKTTNLQYIHGHVRPESRGKLVSLATQTDRTLFFDFLPLDLGIISGYTVRLHLYTVPGQVHYNATRKLVLKGVDGVVFVADSQRAMRDANLESFLNLERNLASYGKDLRTLPHIIQANKQDLSDILTVDELGGLLNRHGAPVRAAAAASGTGVQETLGEIVRLVINDLRGQFRAEVVETRPSSSADTEVPQRAVIVPGLTEGPAPEKPHQAAEATLRDAGVRMRETGSDARTAAEVSGDYGAQPAQIITPGGSCRSRFTLRLPSGEDAELTVEISYRACPGASPSSGNLPSVEVRILGAVAAGSETADDAEVISELTPVVDGEGE